MLEDGTIADSIVEAMKRGKDDWTLEVAKKRKREVPPEKTGPSQVSGYRHSVRRLVNID